MIQLIAGKEEIIMEEMEKIEKVQKLCEKTGATAEVANAALEACKWDMFEAFLMLDKERNSGTSQNGNVYASQAGQQGQNNGYAQYSTAGTTDYGQSQTQYQNPKSSNFGESVGKCVKWFGDLIQRGMDNFLDIEREGRNNIRIPVTIAVLLFVFFNVFALALMIVGLFCGFRYSFSGPDFSRKSDYTEGADYGDKDSNRGR